MNSKSRNLFIIAYTIVMIVFRSPRLLISPRFWAEEGQNYFSYAYNHSFFNNIITQFYGYYTFVPNFATSLASHVPLEYAPFITTYIAVLIQILVFCVVVFGTASYWDDFWKKIFVITAILLLSQEETWAHTIHSMFWLALGTFLILLENTILIDGKLKIFYRIMLIIGGLTGVVSCFMTPVYYLKSYHTKLKEDLIHAIILSLCTFLQLIVFVTTYLTARSTLADRLNSENINVFRILLRHFVWPFVGNFWKDNSFLTMMCDKLNALFGYKYNYNSGQIGPQKLILILFMIYFIYLAIKYIKSYQVQYIVYSFIIISIMSTLLSISMGSGDRYIFVPSICLFMLIYNSILDNNKYYIRYLSIFLATIILTITLCAYHLRMESLANPSWPQWSEEVKLWRSNPKYELRIWPQFGAGGDWVVKLNRK